jgi:hypothetical protein
MCGRSLLFAKHAVALGRTRASGAGIRTPSLNLSQRLCRGSAAAASVTTWFYHQKDQRLFCLDELAVVMHVRFLLSLLVAQVLLDGSCFRDSWQDIRVGLI